MTSSDARKYLDLLESLPSEHLGPLRRYDPDAVEPVSLLELGHRIAESVKQIDDRTYLASSPWHAAAWLLDVAALAAHVASFDAGRGLRAPYDPRLGAPVFRGQGNPSWKLLPGIRREPKRSSDWLALEIFAEATGTLAVDPDNRMNDRKVHIAAAQHYGMRTPLLDFTLDPRVAVAFANDGSTESINSNVVVYGLPFNLLTNLGGLIILPPPWVKRLYAQRGLFLDCSRLPEDFDIQNSCFRVLFPPAEGYAHWYLKYQPGGLLPEDSWYECAIKWANSLAESFDLRKHTDHLAEMLKSQCRDTHRMYFIVQHQELLNQFVDILEWVALKAVSGTPHYDANSIETLWAGNQLQFREIRAVWHLLRRELNLRPEILRRKRLMAAMEAVSTDAREL